MSFTKNEVRERTSAYFENDELAPDVFMKYALRDADDNLLEADPDMMHRRLAREFARIESKYPNPMDEDEVYDLLKNFADVVPQGSPMSGIGNPYQLQSLSNCFVIDQPHDSYGGILFSDQEQVQIMKRRGGVGMDISNIRPKGQPTSNAARTTDGLAVFMERFSNSTREVAQGGRRGALMLTIHCFEGSTLVLTDKGWKRIDDVVNNKFDGRVWTHEGWKEIEAYQRFEDSEIYEVEAANGKVIKVTADHKFVVKNITTGEEYLKPIKEVDVENEELVFYDVSLEVTNVVKTTSKIKRISPAGKSTTYDFTVKDTHRILANGFYTSNCNHPEIETFIDIKRDLRKVTGANISIRFTDEFMRAVESSSEFTLRWPVESSPADAEITKTINAKQIWDKFIDAAWSSAEPGALFWDTITKNGIPDCYQDIGYKTISTNPCGEIALSPYDSCRLMVVNLTSFVDFPFTTGARFDFGRFVKVAKKAQRLMDDLVDLEIECVDRILEKIERDPQPDHVKRIEWDLWRKIKSAGQNGRRTGLGITGLGDALAAMNIRYGSNLSIETTAAIYQHLAMGAHMSSCQLAAERGSFPVFSYEKEKDHPYLSRIMEACGADTLKLWQTTGRRNIALTTTAPVGSVSCLTRTTSGIEPAFMLSYKRRRKITQGDLTSRHDYTDQLGDKWQEYTVYHHWFKKWMDITGKTDPKESPYWGGTANDIDWEKSVDIQAAAQHYVDHSISKTCNLPNSATKETVDAVYMRAWKTGCKGFTVYRDGCRAGVLVATDEPKKESRRADDGRFTPKRAKSLSCDIHRANIRNGENTESWLVLVGLNEGRPYEVFCGIPENIEIPKKYKSGAIIKNGKRDGITTYNLHVPVGDDENMIFKDVVNLFDNPTQGAFTRTISLALRHEVPLHYVVEQLQKDKNSDMFSYARVISRVLKGYIKDGTKSSEKGCPECGSDNLVYQEGCLSCVSCGHAKCG